MRYAQKTLEKINSAISEGAEIVENTNWKFTGKRAGFSRCEKLAQTNDRRSGWPKRIIWACYR